MVRAPVTGNVGRTSVYSREKVVRPSVIRLAVAVAVLLLAAAFAADAQQAGKRIPRIGYLSADSESPRAAAFRQGLRDLGYIEGQNIMVEYRFADGKYERLSGFASDLVRLNVDLIVTSGGAANRAAEQATQDIPVVTALSDVVGTESPTILARPRGNITGLTNMNAELMGKRLALLKEALPRLSRVVLLRNPLNPLAAAEVIRAETAARTLGFKIQVVDVRGPDDLERAFETIVQERASALVDLPDTLFFVHRKRLAEIAARHRLPTMYQSREHPEAGSLMSYGASVAELHRRAATYVDKILRGARPADLPIEQPTKFELVINLKTAKALGLTMPPSLLLQADQVIE